MILFVWHWIINRQDITFDKVTKELTEHRQSFAKLELDLAITKTASHLGTKMLCWNVSAVPMLSTPHEKLWKYLEYPKILTMVN